MPYTELENIILDKHKEITACKVIDPQNGKIEVVVEPHPPIELQWDIEDTVEQYFGDDWEGVAFAFGKKEYKRLNKSKSCFSLRKR